MNREEKHEAQRLKFVQQLGELLTLTTHNWNNKLLDATESKCNFVKGYHFVLFPRGLEEVVAFFEGWQDQLMLEYLSSIEPQTKIREKIAIALNCRIKNFISKPAHIKNCTYFAIPANVIQGIRLAWNTCDLIWVYAGDKATDLNHYTKRSLLLTVYLSGILFYIDDQSENNIDTENFIASSLNNIIKLGNLKKFFNRSSLDNIPVIRLFS